MMVLEPGWLQPRRRKWPDFRTLQSVPSSRNGARFRGPQLLEEDQGFVLDLELPTKLQAADSE